MFCRMPGSRYVRAEGFAQLGACVLLVLAGWALLSWRAVAWFLLKRSLRRKFHDVRWITIEELADWLVDERRPEPVLLDVRDEVEWNVSQLPGARHLDPPSAAAKAVAQLAKETPIVTYCAVGYRSAQAAQHLQIAGYKNVQNLEGSIFEWANEGRPLTCKGVPTDRVHPYSRFWARFLKPQARAPDAKAADAGS
jgi:rhodanese-related sulfurtransferase